MALSMLSLGIFSALAARTAARSLGLALISPPPKRAATIISLMTLVKSFPRLASAAPFFRLIVLHFECPDISFSRWLRVESGRWKLQNHLLLSTFHFLEYGGRYWI